MLGIVFLSVTLSLVPEALLPRKEPLGIIFDILFKGAKLVDIYYIVLIGNCISIHVYLIFCSKPKAKLV
jgi:hypothetical protein